MACQEWQQQHVCPICSKSDRNIGGAHNAWVCFDGCITHLTTAGHLLNEEPLTGRGKSVIPSVATMLMELYPNESARGYLPLITIVYMGPGGHRQWPLSISALLDRLSWLVLQTRPLALSSFQAAVQKSPRWGPVPQWTKSGYSSTTADQVHGHRNQKFQNGMLRDCCG